MFVSEDPAERRELEGFGPAARRAVTLAEAEARHLGHDRLGTEHLLLGLLALEGGEGIRLVGDTRVTLAAARDKTGEAVGLPVSPRRMPAGLAPTTMRAGRALGRSLRFSRQCRADFVSPQHLLLAILDVEGTACQVLRGLGLEPEVLRVRLDAPAVPPESGPAAPVAGPDLAPAPRPEASLPEALPATAATCRTCGRRLDNALVYGVVTARGEGGRGHDVLVFSCGACGTALGVGPT